MASGSTSLPASDGTRVQPGSIPEALQWLRKNFRSERAQELCVAYQFELTGEQGGALWTRVVDGRLEGGTGRIEEPDVVFRLEAGELFGVFAGTANPDLLFMQRKLEVEGDLSLALKLRTLFSASD